MRRGNVVGHTERTRLYAVELITRQIPIQVCLASQLAAVPSIGCGGRASVAVEVPDQDSTPVTPICSGGLWAGDFHALDTNDLKKLASIRDITGSLSIEGANITDLQDLKCLRSVGGDFDIGRCDFSTGTCEDSTQLASLDGLQQLESVSGRLMIGGNAKLATLEALSGLSLADEALIILQNPLLVDLSGLTHLTHTGWLRIEQNESLVDLSGLDHLTETACSVLISNNARLRSLRGLEALGKTDGLSVVWNSQLGDLSGLSGLTAIGSGSACASQPPYGWVSTGADFSRLDSIKSLEGLSKLTSVVGQLRLVGNSALQSLTGAPNLQEIRGSLDIEVCGSLPNLDGLSGLTTLAKDVHIENCSMLQNVTVLAPVQWITPNNSSKYSGVVIANNARLASLAGISPTGDLGLLSIVNNDQLDTIGDMGGLTNVQTVSISENDALQRLEFSSSLSGLADLTIANNPALPSCQAAQLATLWHPNRTPQICGNQADSCSSGPCSNVPRP